ncbi:MAG: hypothetical protein AB1716_01125 [Planctomycetota bacterium]
MPLAAAMDNTGESFIPESGALSLRVYTTSPIPFVPDQERSATVSSTIASERLTNGVAYRLHVWMKGQAKRVELSVTAGTESDSFGYGLRAADNGEPSWTELWSPPVTHDGSSPMTVRIHIFPREIDRHLEAWLGAAELTAAPFDGDWVPSQDVQLPSGNLERFDYERVLPQEWTHLSSTVLLPSSDELARALPGQRHHIRTYEHPESGHYVELYYETLDPQEGAGAFQLAADGGPTLASTGPCWLTNGAHVFFAVRRAADGRFKLSVADGGGVQHCAYAYGPAVPDSPTTWKILSGGHPDPLHRDVVAQVILEDVICECELSATEIEQAFSVARLSNPP